MKVLRWSRKSEMEILCFLHVLEGADSEKVDFEHWSVSHSACLLLCLSETTLQLELKELETSNLVRESLVPVGHHNKVFEKIAHAQRVAAIELFWFLKALLKNEKSYGLQIWYTSS